MFVFKWYKIGIIDRPSYEIEPHSWLIITVALILRGAHNDSFECEWFTPQLVGILLFFLPHLGKTNKRVLTSNYSESDVILCEKYNLTKLF